MNSICNNSVTIPETNYSPQRIIEYERIKVLEQITNNIAHVFNNLLMPIIGYSDFLLCNPETLQNRGETFEMLSAIRDAAITARESVRNLKKTNNDDVSHIPIMVRDLMDQSVSITQPRLKEEKRLSDSPVHINIKTDGDMFVRGNPDELCEALSNLLLNAFESLPKGGNIDISAKITDSGKGVEIRIADNGTGMTEDVQKHCTEPFFSTKNDNYGVGLSITCGLILKHNGIINITSTQRKGTTVTIHLPSAV